MVKGGGAFCANTWGRGRRAAVGREWFFNEYSRYRTAISHESCHSLENSAGNVVASVPPWEGSCSYTSWLSIPNTLLYMVFEPEHTPSRLCKCVLFTDEACFTRERIYNSHNSHVWSKENPHATNVRSHQHRFRVNVWAGIVDDFLLGPYIVPTLIWYFSKMFCLSYFVRFPWTSDATCGVNMTEHHLLRECSMWPFDSYIRRSLDRYGRAHCLAGTLAWPNLPMSHSTSNRTVFDLHVTDFYETFYRHSTNRNPQTIIILSSSQSIIVIVESYQNL